MNELIHTLRSTGLTDGQLLGSYIEARDEAAFAALVRRHGPMVWGVCRRLLGPHDAEDAFQATFLVLVRKANSIMPREQVANWLYGVAHQTARMARRTVARRTARERQVTHMPEPAVIERDLWRDLQPVFDHELSQLPGVYREVIVLSDLEGKTRREVARQLGVPEGTVGSRLGRARALLAKRLSRRGLATPSAALAAVAAEQAATACVPTALLSTTITAAGLVAAGQVAATGVVSAKVAALTEGVLKAMLLTKLKSAFAIVLVLSLLATGTGILTYRTLAAQGDQPPAAKEPQVHADAAGVLALPVGAIARLGNPRLRHGSRLKHIAYSPNGHRLASVGYDTTLRVWDAEDGLPLFAVMRPEGGFDKVAFASQGAVVVAIGPEGDRRAALWRIDAATGKVLDRLTLEAALPRPTLPTKPAASFSFDGARLALATIDKKQLLLIDTSNGRVLWTADLGQEIPGGVAFAPDGETVAAATHAGRVHLFDREGKPLAHLTADRSAKLATVALSPDGKMVVARNDQPEVRQLIAWDRATGQIAWKQEGYGGEGFAFTPDSSTMLNCGYWGIACAVDAADGLPPGKGNTRALSFDSMAEVRCLALHPAGKTVAFGTDSGTICLRDIETGKPVAPTAEPLRYVDRVRFSADGKSLYGWALDWLAWDVTCGKQRFVTHFGGWNFNLPLSPDGKYILQTRPGHGLIARSSIEVHDTTTGNVVHSFSTDAGQRVDWYDFTPDGKAIVISHGDGTFHVLSFDGEVLAQMSGHKGQPTYHAFSASGQVMVTATNLDPPNTEEFSVRVWDLKTGKELGKFNPGMGNRGNGYSYGSLVALSGDGKRVAALTYSNSYGKPEPNERATVWDVATGQVLARVPQGGDSGCIALSPDGRLVAVAALWKNDIWVYDVAGGGERFHFRAGGEVTSLAFAPDGRSLAAASKEAPMLLWDVSAPSASSPPPAAREKK